MYEYFKWQTGVGVKGLDIAHEKIWILPRKGNLKREAESLSKASQYYAIRINSIKAKIDKRNIQYKL